MNLHAYKLNFVFSVCFGSHAFVVGKSLGVILILITSQVK